MKLQHTSYSTGDAVAKAAGIFILLIAFFLLAVGCGGSGGGGAAATSSQTTTTPTTPEPEPEPEPPAPIIPTTRTTIQETETILDQDAAAGNIDTYVIGLERGSGGQATQNARLAVEYLQEDQGWPEQDPTFDNAVTLAANAKFVSIGCVNSVTLNYLGLSSKEECFDLTETTIGNNEIIVEIVDVGASGYGLLIYGDESPWLYIASQKVDELANATNMTVATTKVLFRFRTVYDEPSGTPDDYDIIAMN